jgi:16S rRNA (uracil1498-N3)-methyltransferase
LDSLMHRFFVSPDAFDEGLVTLVDEQAHQIRRVLRLRLGNHVLLLDNQGWMYEARLIAIDDQTAKFQITTRKAATGEPRTQITLHQAVLKGDRFTWVLQKGTEVGISRFVPLICERNIVDDLEAVERKRSRWERVIVEAAEQSRRARLPELAPTQRLGEACAPLQEDQNRAAPGLLRLIAWEEETSLNLRDALADCNFAEAVRIELFVGPEGGFTEAEVDLARRSGVQPVTLGPRILRAETAGLVAAAAILYEAGDI